MCSNIVTLDAFLNMEILKTRTICRQTTLTPTPPSVHYCRVVYILYTLCICKHFSSGSGFKKEQYIQFLQRILAINKVLCVLFFKAQKIRHQFFCCTIVLCTFAAPTLINEFFRRSFCESKIPRTSFPAFEGLTSFKK